MTGGMTWGCEGMPGDMTGAEGTTGGPRAGGTCWKGFIQAEATTSVMKLKVNVLRYENVTSGRE